MERVAAFFLILCSFFNVNLTQACFYDGDCYGDFLCCRIRGLDDGVCVDRNNCYGVCRNMDDCSAPEICDSYQNLCTTECSHSSECHDGYKCDDRVCVSDEDSTDSDFNVSSLVAIILGIGMIIFLLCCCAVRQTRNSRPGNVDTNRTSQAPRGTNTQQNGTSSIGQEAAEPAEPHNEEFIDEVPDPIAEAAPPAYEDVNNQPEPPPPSYEEVIRASHEILPHDSASTQV